MTDPKVKATEDMVYAATDLGIVVVKEMAHQCLLQRPQATLREFLTVLAQYKTKVQASITVE